MKYKVVRIKKKILTSDVVIDKLPPLHDHSSKLISCDVAVTVDQGTDRPGAW